MDPLSLPGIAEERVPMLWNALDFAERCGLRKNPWRPSGVKRPLAEV
jgi:hypothetical protein